MTKNWTEGFEVDKDEDVMEHDVNQILQAHKGYHVVSGLGIDPDSPTSDEVYCNAGIAWCETETEVISPGENVGPFDPVTGGSLERYDLVVIDTTGLSIVKGTEQATGQGLDGIPDIPEDKITLAFVFINETTGSVDIIAGDITDRRIFTSQIFNELVGSGAAITESKLLFDDSTGHTHGGTGDDGTNVPEANVDFDFSAGHDHDGSNSKSISKLEKANLIGVANKAPIPCGFDGVDDWTAMRILADSYGTITNDGSTNFDTWHILKEPTDKNGLKLYIDDILLPIRQADGTNYIDKITILGFPDYSSAGTTLFTDDTDIASGQDKLYTFSPVDCSGYKTIKVRIETVVADQYALRYREPLIYCYYD